MKPVSRTCKACTLATRPGVPEVRCHDESAAIASRPGVFRCHACKAQFTVTVGTVMEGTDLPLRHWYLAMYLMMSPANRSAP